MTRRWWLWVGSMLFVAGLAACGTGSDGAVTVALAPASVVVAPGSSVTFTATVVGATEDGVTWSTDGGTLEVAGNRVTYTAPTAFGAYTVVATSVANHRVSAAARVLLEIRQTMTPAEDTVLESGGSAVRVQVPAGAVDAEGDLTIRSVAPETLPEEAERIVAAASVGSSRVLEQLARLSFLVPEEELAAGIGYQVFRRGTESEPWERVPTVAIDGRLTVVTPSFSEFALAVTEVLGYDRHHVVPGFDSAVHGIHFWNRLEPMRSAFGDDAVESLGVFNGICYGMSMTSADFFAADTPSPVGREYGNVASFGLPTASTPQIYASETLVRYVSSRQNTQYLEFVQRVMSNWYLDFLNEYAMVSEVQRVVAAVRAGHPAPVGVGGGGLNPLSQIQSGHVVLAYGARESYDATTDELRIVLDVYDPNRYAGVHPSTQQHWHNPATITLTVRNYEGGKRLFQRPTVDLRHGLNWQFDIDVLFKMDHQPQTANLPRSNPTVTALDVVHTDTVVRLEPTVTHASPGGQVTRLAWRVSTSAGEVRSYGLTDVGAPATHVEISRSALGTGPVVAHVVARDAQGAWSNALATTLTVAPGQLGVTITGLPSGVPGNVLVTGPSSFSQTLTSSTTLTVPPGTYTIAASGVSSGGTTYAPTPANQQRTVTSNGSASATVAYAQGVTVALSPTSASLIPGATRNFTANVTGTTNTAVSWTLTPNCGTLSGIGNTRTYTAPATGPATCTLTATSTADTTRTANATIDVQPGSTVPWRLAPSPLTFEGLAGGAAPPPRSVTIYNDATISRSFTLSSTTMVSLSPTMGSLPAGGSASISVAVAACPPDDPPGTTTSTITATGGGGGTGTASVARICGEVPDVGMIDVIITGLPTGTDADVFIEGQGWRLWPRTSVLLPDMPPGSYQMTANHVTASGTMYYPTPTGSTFTVTAGATTTVAIAHAPAVSVALSPTSASLTPGATQSFTATVTGTTNTAVTWTLTPSCGTFTGTGNTRTYTAPAAGPATCTLTATSSADTTKAANATITVSAGNRAPTIDEVWLRYQSGERFECGSVIPQEYIGFYWRSSDPDGDTVTHQYRVDDGAWRDRSGTSVNLWLDDLPPGTLRTLWVRAIDGQGNLSAASSCAARVSMPPEIIDYAGPTDALGYRVGETPAFAVDVRDADGHYPSEVVLTLRRDGATVATLQMALQFDQGPATKLTYVATYRFTVAGSYDYLIWVTDALGVMADATDRVPFTIYP